MRFFKWLLAPDTNWHKESLAYHERSSRHMNSLDPNYWKAIDNLRSTAGNLREHPAPYKPTPREKRDANSLLYKHRDYIANWIWERSKPDAAGREETEADTRFVN